MICAASRWFFALSAIVLTAVCEHDSLAQNTGDECPVRGVSWTADNIQQCIDDLTKRIDQTKGDRRAALLAKRAQFYEYLGYDQAQSAESRMAALEAALADYSAAIALASRDHSLRYRRAQLLMRMERGAEALEDADALVAQEPRSVKFQALKGTALAFVKRHQEAIQVYTRAITLAQSCAEASAIQRQANEFHHAFDPPLTKEQLEETFKKFRLYDVPEPGVAKLGFPCVPTRINEFEDLVSTKQALFMWRAESYRDLGDPWAALKDYKYAASLSSVRELVSVSLCDLEVELKLDYDAVVDCRYAFDFNTYVILGDPDRAAKIGSFLLEDGDLKGACRIAFPFPLEGMQSYVDNSNIKALQARVKGGLEGAGLKSCGAEFRW